MVIPKFQEPISEAYIDEAILRLECELRRDRKDRYSVTGLGFTFDENMTREIKMRPDVHRRIRTIFWEDNRSYRQSLSSRLLRRIWNRMWRFLLSRPRPVLGG